MNHIFMMNKIIKKQKSPFFLASTELTKYKIENNGFITILGSVYTKVMIYITNFC